MGGLGMCAVATRSQPFFFFQAEDGIRDLTVTGVTCALPISDRAGFHAGGQLLSAVWRRTSAFDSRGGWRDVGRWQQPAVAVCKLPDNLVLPTRHVSPLR